MTTMILPILFLLGSCYFRVLRAQKGPLDVALPVCNSRELSDAETKSFNDIIRIANSSFPCSASNGTCCENNDFDVNIRFTCNAEVNMCEVRLPTSSRPGRQGNLNIVALALCARPGERCEISSKQCTPLQMIRLIFSYLESERLLCAWDRSTERSPIGCLVFDIFNTNTIPRKERCDPHIGSGSHAFRERLSFSKDITNQSMTPSESPEAPQPSKPSAQVSPISPSPSSPASPAASPSPSPAACFPGHATVQLSDKRDVRMDALRVGDLVQVSDRLTSRVFTFSHRDEHMLAQFVQIRTISSLTLMVTPGHLVYVEGRRLVPAESVHPGDKLILANGQVAQVHSTERTIAKGVYNPQTLQGDIVVDGFIVSTFTTSFPHPAAHAMLAPVRAAFSTFGIRFRSLESDRNILVAFLRNHLCS